VASTLSLNNIISEPIPDGDCLYDSWHVLVIPLAMSMYLVEVLSSIASFDPAAVCGRVEWRVHDY
jgi:hypothetical protein